MAKASYDPLDMSLYPGPDTAGDSSAAPAGLTPSPYPGLESMFLDLKDNHPGTIITSLMRSKEHNRKVHGVVNSQHIGGTAGDYVVPEEEKPSFLADAQSKGFVAIDEGDHIHLQLPKGAGPAAAIPQAAAKYDPLDMSQYPGPVAGAKPAPVLPSPKPVPARTAAPKPAVAAEPKGFFQGLVDDFNAPEPTANRAAVGNWLHGVQERVGTGWVQTIRAVGASRDFSEAEQDIVNAKRGYRESNVKGEVIRTPVPRDILPEAQKKFAKASIDLFKLRNETEALTKDTYKSAPRHSLEQALQKSDHSWAGTIDAYTSNPAGAADQLVEGGADFIPTMLVGAVNPTAGIGAAAAQLGLGKYSSAIPDFAQKQGVDLHDQKQVDDWLANPDNVSAAIHYRDLTTNATIGAVAAGAPIAKIASKFGGTGSALSRVVKSSAVSVPANVAVFTGAEAGANAVSGVETTPGEVVGNAVTIAGLHAMGLPKQYRGEVKAIADHVNYTTYQQELGAQADARKAQANAVQDAMYEGQQAGKERQHKENFTKAEQDKQEQDQQAADQAEADQRNQVLINQYQNRTRVVKYPDGSMERVKVHPPAEVTPEQVKAEREQAQADKVAADAAEADRLKRVELGGLAEQIRKRQEEIAKKAADAQAKAEKKREDEDNKRRLKIRDQVIAENPGKSHEELAPVLKARLDALPPLPKAVPAQEAAPVAPEQTAPTEAPTKPAAPSNLGVWVPSKANENQVRVDVNTPGTLAVGGTGAVTYYVRAGEHDKKQLAMVVAKDGKLVPGHTTVNLDNTNNGVAWTEGTPEQHAAVVDLLHQRAQTKLGSPERTAIEEQIKGVVTGDNKTATPQSTDSAAETGKPAEPNKPSKPDSEMTEADLRALERDAGLHTPEPKTGTGGLNMSSTAKGEKGTPSTRDKIHGLLTNLMKVSGPGSKSVQESLLNGRVIIHASAEAAGRKDDGVANYEDGVTRVYLDKLDPKEPGGIVGHFLQAVAFHEPTHHIQLNPREGRGKLMSMIADTSQGNQAGRLLHEGAAAGNKVAQEAMRLSEAAGHAASEKGQDGQWVASHETMANFAHLAKAARDKRGTLGRLRDVPKMLVSAARHVLHEKTGMDLNVTLDDLEFATRHIAGEANKTKTTAGNGESAKVSRGGLNMVVEANSPTGKRLQAQGVKPYTDKDNVEKLIASDRDSEFNLTPEQQRKLRTGQGVRVGDALKNPTINESYPHLNEAMIYADIGTPGAAWMHRRDPKKSELRISPDFLNDVRDNPQGMSKLHNVVLHEIQHGQQEAANSGRGGSPAQFRTPEERTLASHNNAVVQDLEDNIVKAGGSIKNLGLDSIGQQVLASALDRFQKGEFAGDMLEKRLQPLFDQATTPEGKKVLKDIILDLGIITKLRPPVDAMEKRTKAEYNRLLGEQESSFTEHNRLTKQEDLPTRVPTTDDTIVTKKVGKIANAFRQKGEGEINPRAYEFWADDITGGNTDAIMRGDVDVPDAETRNFHAWATKAVKRYLDKYAGTPDDPLKDIVLPDGQTWEDAMDKSVRSYPATASMKAEFTPASVGHSFPHADRIKNYLGHVGDYMQMHVDPEKYGQYDLARAVKETAAADAAALKKASQAQAKSMEGMPVYKAYPDGTKWVQLTRPGEFAHESDIMGHSVRGYEPPKQKTPYDYDGEADPYDRPHPDWIPASGDSGHASYGHGGWEAIKSSEAKIYSLRDKNGVSHVTIEVGTGSTGHPYGKSSIYQIKGKGNAKPAAKYIPYVQDFVKSGKWDNLHDLENADLIPDENNPGKFVTEEELKPYLRELDGHNDYHTNGDVSQAFRKMAKAEDNKPTSLNMAAKDRPTEDGPDDTVSVPREVGEPPHRYAERIALANSGILKEAADMVFGNPERDLARQNQVEWMAVKDRAFNTMERAFGYYKGYADFLTEEQRMLHNDEFETGRPITDPVLKKMYESINPLFAPLIEQIRTLDPAGLQKLRERYLPHIYKKPARATSFFQTKGPLAGDKAFLKKRKWPTLKEATKPLSEGGGGLELVTSNPAELAMLKYGEMLKYAGLLNARADMIDRGWAEKITDDFTPEGWAKVKDPSFNGYVVKDFIAKDLNNYLSRGLSDVPGFKQLRSVENFFVGAKLGWSGFHAGFTTMDTFGTHLDVAFRQGLSMHPIEAMTTLVKGFASPLISPYEGGILLKMSLGQKSKTLVPGSRWGKLVGIDQHAMALIDLATKGGARAFMDASEWNGGLPKLQAALRQYNLKDTAASTLSAISDASGWLIHRKLVPAQKMAARQILLKFELDRFAKDLGKDRGDYTGIIEAMRPDAARQIANKVVNLIDDRLGHMIYDNQFWNPYAKHMAQLTVMAPGWAVGTYRTIAGGFGDTRRLISPEKINGPLDKEGKITDAKFGRLTSRTSNLIALSLMTAASSGVFMYMLTGQWPETVKDYVHPKTGRKNADGTDERISWPTYAKEHWALITDSVNEVEGKFNQPVLKMGWELGHNADFTNTQIWDPDAPIAQEAKQVATYIAAGFVPIVGDNAKKADKMDQLNPDYPHNKALRYSAFVGMTDAASKIDQSKAEQFINERYFGTFGKDPVSLDRREGMNDKAALNMQLRQGQHPDLSNFSRTQQTKMKNEAKQEVYSVRFKSIRYIEDKVKAYEMATPEERTKYDLKKLLLNNARSQIAGIHNKDTRATIQQKINDIRNSP